ncbi:MAG: Ku protein [Candidatus Obscuribacterales bacterium]|nr:Ku protein [Candidatus Obscuribacterales bacterium]
MARAMWSGVIGFGLVSIPIKLYSAIESKTTSFHQIHEACNTQIKEVRWCPTCDRKVEWTEIVKGYEYEKGKFVPLTEEDMAKLPLSSKNLINVNSFVKLEQIDPIYFEKSYFIEPDKKAEHAFALLSQALAQKKMVGIASITLRSRERLCMLRPSGQSILMSTLYYPDELRLDLAQNGPVVKIPAKELELANHLIDMLADDFKPELYTDHYRAALNSLLEAKVEGLPVEEQPSQVAGGKVLDLMASLQASLERAKSRTQQSEKTSKKVPSKEKDVSAKTKSKSAAASTSKKRSA